MPLSISDEVWEEAVGRTTDRLTQLAAQRAEPRNYGDLHDELGLERLGISFHPFAKVLQEVGRREIGAGRPPPIALVRVKDRFRPADAMLDVHREDGYDLEHKLEAWMLALSHVYRHWCPAENSR